MFRYVFELVSALVVFGLMRSVISAVTRSMGSMGADQPGRSSETAETREMRVTGELRKDPVCGTFVAMNTPFTRTVEGVTTYFCSKECRDQFRTGRNTNSEWQKSTAARS